MDEQKKTTSKQQNRSNKKKKNTNTDESPNENNVGNSNILRIVSACFIGGLLLAAIITSTTFIYAFENKYRVVDASVGCHVSNIPDCIYKKVYFSKQPMLFESETSYFTNSYTVEVKLASGFQPKVSSKHNTTESSKIYENGKFEYAIKNSGNVIHKGIKDYGEIQPCISKTEEIQKKIETWADIFNNNGYKDEFIVNFTKFSIRFHCFASEKNEKTYGLGWEKVVVVTITREQPLSTLFMYWLMFVRALESFLYNIISFLYVIAADNIKKYSGLA